MWKHENSSGVGMHSVCLWGCVQGIVLVEGTVKLRVKIWSHHTGSLHCTTPGVTMHKQYNVCSLQVYKDTTHWGQGREGSMVWFEVGAAGRTQVITNPWFHTQKFDACATVLNFPVNRWNMLKIPLHQQANNFILKQFVSSAYQINYFRGKDLNTGFSYTYLMF